MAATIIDVARLCGYSKATVSRAYASPEAVSEKAPSTEGSAATTSDAQTEDTGVATADTMRAVPFVLMMFVAMTAFVVLAGRKKKEVR